MVQFLYEGRYKVPQSAVDFAFHAAMYGIGDKYFIKAPIDCSEKQFRDDIDGEAQYTARLLRHGPAIYTYLPHLERFEASSRREA